MNLPYMSILLSNRDYSVSFLVVLLGLRTVVLRVPVEREPVPPVPVELLRGLRLVSECVPELVVRLGLRTPSEGGLASVVLRGLRVPTGRVPVPPGFRVMLRVLVSSAL